jgi:hypothetical protein
VLARFGECFKLYAGSAHHYQPWPAASTSLMHQIPHTCFLGLSKVRVAKYCGEQALSMFRGVSRPSFSILPRHSFDMSGLMHLVMTLTRGSCRAILGRWPGPRAPAQIKIRKRLLPGATSACIGGNDS